MDGVQVVREALQGSHVWFQGTVADVTAAQANERPDGVASPIAVAMAHVLHAEDGLINQLQGKPPVWQRDGWAERLGLPMMVVQDAELARTFTCDPKALIEYSQAVYASTDAYLDSLTDADLDREMDLPGLGKVTLGKYLTFLLAGNTFAHTGEISTMKGLQGNRGYPF